MMFGPMISTYDGGPMMGPMKKTYDIKPMMGPMIDDFDDLPPAAFVAMKNWRASAL